MTDTQTAYRATFTLRSGNDPATQQAQDFIGAEDPNADRAWSLAVGTTLNGLEGDVRQDVRHLINMHGRARAAVATREAYAKWEEAQQQGAANPTGSGTIKVGNFSLDSGIEYDLYLAVDIAVSFQLADLSSQEPSALDFDDLDDYLATGRMGFTS